MRNVFIYQMDEDLLEIRPNGVKSWIVRYFVEGKENRKHIGEFPEISIREARETTLRIKGQAKMEKHDQQALHKLCYPNKDKSRKPASLRHWPYQVFCLTQAAPFRRGLD
jgi:hypothetical protein